MTRPAPIIALTLSLFGCLPELDDRASNIQSNRIIAVIGEPAEVSPGDTARITVVVASPDGVVEEPQAYFSLCLAPKSLAENNAVNEDCWAKEYLPVGGPAASLDIVIPEDACSRFGPEVLSAEDRPRDADETGGYYQPIRVAIPELAGFGFERIRCSLPNASADVSLAFEDRYRDNVNPKLSSLAAGAGHAAPGEKVTLLADFAPDSAESFLLYDTSSQSLRGVTEELRVSWFATAGMLAFDVTDASDDGQSSSVEYTAPDSPASVTLWAVLRDSRGGSDVMSAALVVK